MTDETLRKALLREIDSRISPSEWPDGLADRVLAAIDAALAAPAPTVDAAALDVETLARALYAEMQSRRSWDEAPLGMHTSLRTSATAIAREYAALRASAPAPTVDAAALDAAALALAGSRPSARHGQLCPVWTQRMRKRHAAVTIADCDCWVLPDARTDAGVVVAALRASAPGDEPAPRVGQPLSNAEWDRVRMESDPIAALSRASAPGDEGS